MTILEDGLRAALHAEAQSLQVPERPALDRDTVELRRRSGFRHPAGRRFLGRGPEGAGQERRTVPASGLGAAPHPW